MKKPFPKLKTDREAERFVDIADLSQYDFSSFKRTSFEFEPKSKSVTMRLPESLLAAVRARAESQGMPYQKLIRIAIEKLVAENLTKSGSVKSTGRVKGRTS
jgi:predicted DNA binding CopG/RHH family protein